MDAIAVDLPTQERHLRQIEGPGFNPGQPAPQFQLMSSGEWTAEHDDHASCVVARPVGGPFGLVLGHGHGLNLNPLGHLQPVLEQGAVRQANVGAERGAGLVYSGPSDPVHVGAQATEWP